MNLYLITQNENTVEAYTAMVVAAEDEEAARRMLPLVLNNPWYQWKNGALSVESSRDKWAFARTSIWATRLSSITVRHIGTATPGTEAGVVLASYQEA